MKKIIFLFALFLGIGISLAQASDVRPPGYKVVTISLQCADMVTNEMPSPVTFNVSPEVVAAKIYSTSELVFLNVEFSSSGGIADRWINKREIELELYWSTIADHLGHIDKDRAWCANKKIYNIPVFATNCNFKFPLT